MKSNCRLYSIHIDGQRKCAHTRDQLRNLIGDAIMSYGQDAFSQPADFAVTNGGGIRADIKQGPLKLGMSLLCYLWQ